MIRLPTFALALMVFVVGCAGIGPSIIEAEKFEAKVLLAVPFEEQMTATSCGAAALAGVLVYWKAPISQQTITESWTPDSENGYSLGELKAIATDLSLRAFVVAGDRAFVQRQLDMGRPLITPLRVDADYVLEGRTGITPVQRFAANLLTPKYWHYVTLIGYDREFFVLMDPVFGMRRVDSAHLFRMWEPARNALLLVSK